MGFTLTASIGEEDKHVENYTSFSITILSIHPFCYQLNVTDPYRITAADESNDCQ
jgi:hypothetical protein